MENNINTYIMQIEMNKVGATPDQIQQVQSLFEIAFPDDYLDLMKKHNGGKGEIDKNSWLELFSLTDLDQINNNYFIPDETNSRLHFNWKRCC